MALLDFEHFELFDQPEILSSTNSLLPIGDRMSQNSICIQIDNDDDHFRFLWSFFYLFFEKKKKKISTQNPHIWNEEDDDEEEEKKPSHLIIFRSRCYLMCGNILKLLSISSTKASSLFPRTEVLIDALMVHFCLLGVFEGNQWLNANKS